MQSLRHQRVRELLKRQVGELVRREIPTRESGLITVNDVGIADDLQSATVFVGIIGNPEQQQKAFAAPDGTVRGSCQQPVRQNAQTIVHLRCGRVPRVPPKNRGRGTHLRRKST